MNITTDLETERLLEEVALSFSTLDEDAPREVIRSCPRCGDEVLARKDQLNRTWELACCGHVEQDKTRATAVKHWNRWAKLSPTQSSGTCLCAPSQKGAFAVCLQRHR